MMNDLKGYQWTQEKDNVALKEFNDNIDLACVSRWSKIFFFRVCIKENNILTFLILWFICDCIFARKKDKLFYPVFVFHRVMSSVICDLVSYLQSEGWNIS